MDIALVSIAGFAMLATTVGVVALAFLGSRQGEAIRTQRKLDSYRRRTLIRMADPRIRARAASR